MQAMVLERPGEPLKFVERPDPAPADGEVRVRVAACGVCRTDLHVVDGELPDPKLPIVPGHEIVGRVDARRPRRRCARSRHARRHSLARPDLRPCPYCREGRENLCDHPLFTGYTRDGGYATHVVADARYVFALPESGDDVATAPLFCAGLIGWRSLQMAGDGEKSAFTASARPPISSPKSRAGRAATSTPSRGGRRRRASLRAKARRGLGRQLR